MKNQKPPWNERPGVWFGLLWQALEEQDFGKAAEAQENLERLGVHVRFQKLPQPLQERIQERRTPNAN
jgi:hypothetical protein